jgi:type II secretory pathway component PulF
MCVKYWRCARVHCSLFVVAVFVGDIARISALIMNYKMSSAYRAELFASLQSTDPNLHALGRLYQVMGDGERVAERADMDDMAQQFAEGQDALLSTLQGSHRFLPWELQMIRVGLETGQIQSVFKRLANHYQHQQDCWLLMKSRLIKTSMITFITLSILALVAVAVLRVPIHVAFASLILVNGLMAFLATGVFWLWRAWQASRLSVMFDNALMIFPALKEILRLRQTYLFLSHLEMVLEAGLGFPQSLRLAERRLLPSSFKNDFEQLIRHVVDGKSFSRQLIERGYLQNIQLGFLPQGADSLSALSLLSEGVLKQYRRKVGIYSEILPVLIGLCLPVYAVYLFSIS